MEIKSKFDHFNINVTDLERSIAFYEKALGLKEHHRKEASDGSGCISSMTRMTIGLRYFHKSKHIKKTGQDNYPAPSFL